MRKQRLFLLALALLLIALSWWGVAAARSGLVVRSIQRNGVPMLYIAPQPSGKIPGILVAHGFAGSKQLMLGYAHVLAHAGYAAMLWDFGGHGANPAPLKGFSLQKDLDIATAALLEQPEVDPTRLALLGHSMGSGAVMSAGIRDLNRFAATVAVSPTGGALTPFAPRNLQLQAGSWEGGFVNNAQQLLKKAGGENNNLSQGRGRKLIIVPNVEHITILFSDASHQAARRWLDATFGVQNNSKYVDRRMVWYALHLLAWLMLLAAITPSLVLPSTQDRQDLRTSPPTPQIWGAPLLIPPRFGGLGGRNKKYCVSPDRAIVLPIKSYFGLLLAPLLASSVLPLINRVANIQNLGGLMVGGALGIWFFVAGTIWLIILWRVPRPTMTAIGLGVALFVVLWMAFGAIAQAVWLQWWLIPARLKLVPLLSLACFPWFLASGISQQNAGAVKRVAWWLLETTMLIGGLLLVPSLQPQLGFIFLVLPLFPPLMAILSFAAAQLNEAWSYAIGSAIFFGWTIASAFPLAA